MPVPGAPVPVPLLAPEARRGQGPVAHPGEGLVVDVLDAVRGDAVDVEPVAQVGLARAPPRHRLRHAPREHPGVLAQEAQQHARHPRLTRQDHADPWTKWEW